MGRNSSNTVIILESCSSGTSRVITIEGIRLKNVHQTISRCIDLYWGGGGGSAELPLMS